VGEWPAINSIPRTKSTVPFTLEKGRLTFRTGDPALTKRLQADRAAGRVCLLGADPPREFTGRLESVKLVKVDRPQQWEVEMREADGARRKRA
jgi:hypothetical protein